MGGELRLRTSGVCYTRAGAGHVAYRVVEGAGAAAVHDVVLVLSGTMPMDALFDDPVALRFVEGLADLGRLVMFDRSGIGLSDPLTDTSGSGWTRWSEDLEAVIVAAEVIRPVLVSQGLGVGAPILYCDRHAGDVSSLVLISPGLRRVEDDIVQRQIAGEADSVALWFPSRAAEPGFREWFTQSGQRGASPGRAARAYPETDPDAVRVIEAAASRLRLPTLVMRRPAHPITPLSDPDPMVALIPTARRVDLPGDDMFAWGGEVDALLAELGHFVTGVHRHPSPDRVLAAILYTDLVASTDRAAAMGDAPWKRVLDRHDNISRTYVGRRGGTVIKMTGDGVLAVFPSATKALQLRRDLRVVLVGEGLEVRIGLHVGEVDIRGDDISGIDAVIAPRILNLAESGQILVSATVVGVTTGGDAQFEPAGDHQLKGVPGSWPLFLLVDS